MTGLILPISVVSDRYFLRVLSCDIRFLPHPKDLPPAVFYGCMATRKITNRAEWIPLYSHLLRLFTNTKTLNQGTITLDIYFLQIRK